MLYIKEVDGVDEIEQYPFIHPIVPLMIRYGINGQPIGRFALVWGGFVIDLPRPFALNWQAVRPSGRPSYRPSPSWVMHIYFPSTIGVLQSIMSSLTLLGAWRTPMQSTPVNRVDARLRVRWHLQRFFPHPYIRPHSFLFPAEKTLPFSLFSKENLSESEIRFIHWSKIIFHC